MVTIAIIPYLLESSSNNIDYKYYPTFTDKYYVIMWKDEVYLI